jgi:phospholipid/cholesterol/gamma-HCH transport system substrate-binding protein
MSILTRGAGRRFLMLGAVIAVVGILLGGFLLYQGTHPGKQVTAYFAETIGVYPGSTVRVLGVAVGTVDSVQPDGARVKVTMTVNYGVAIPAKADAVVLAPSVVADRYIQLTPPYTGGPQLSGGAVIPVTRTAVPLEIDQVYASLAKLANALGPNGANHRSALSELIKTGAANFSGNGGYLRSMLTEFGGLSKTLGGSAGNLFGAIAYLQQFTTMLKHNNGQVQLAEQQLADFSAILASDRQDLSGAINELAIALGQVSHFIASNRALLVTNINRLASVTSALVRERASLAEALDVAPLAADNLVNAYNVATRTLVSRGDLNELSLGSAASGAFTTSDSLLASGAPFGAVPAPQSAIAKLPPLPLPLVGTTYATPQALLGGGR